MLRWFARLALERHRAVLAGSAVVLALSVLVLLRGGTFTSGVTQGIESAIVQETLGRELAYPADSSFIVLFRSAELDWHDPRYKEALAHALAPLRADERVRAVLAPDDAPPLVAKRLVSEDRHRTLVVVTLRDAYFAAQAAYPDLRERVRSDVLEIGFTGFLAYHEDLDRTLERDVVFAEIVSLPLALLVLVAVFGSVYAAALSVGVGALAVVAGVACLIAISHFADVAAYAINVASLIGLGVAIDYSLFIVSRYRDELRGGATIEDALVTALDTTGHAVLFSGFSVAVGLCGLLFFRGSFLASMGLGGSIVVAFSVLFAFTFLPAMLVALGPRIDALKISLPHVASLDGAWHRIATWVMRRPVTVLTASMAVVITFGSPFFRMNLAAADISTLPRGVEARDVYEEVRSAFPDYAHTRILVLLTFPDGLAYTPERVIPMYEYAQSLAALPGVLKVEGAVDTTPQLNQFYFEADAETPLNDLPRVAQQLRSMSTAKNYALLQVVTEASPTSETARNLVRKIRERRQAGEASVQVGGPPANDVDVNHFILTRAPRAVAFILVVTYVVLFAMLRSVILPLKAVLMNLLSIAASFGALIWIFEEGHLSWLLRFEPGPLDAALPVLLFCAVFGMSMDYEVLMLSRMREEYLRTGDNTWAVAEGLERTGRLVTSAAAIMVAVFSAFGIGRVVLVQAMGVALAIAVALDATLVRVLIVPATMRLFGDFNWWAPAFLGGVRPQSRQVPPGVARENGRERSELPARK
jgi:RND superfamily putative drug exporter